MLLIDALFFNRLYLMLEQRRFIAENEIIGVTANS